MGDGAASQADFQRRFLRVFCWLCVSMGTVAVVVAWAVMGLSPHLDSAWVVLGLGAAYGCAGWALVGSRERFHVRHAMALLIVVEIALVAMLVGLRPTESAVGVLSYLTLPMLLAGFLLPPWTIWGSAAVNIVAISLFIVTADEHAADLVRMSATRALVVQVTAAATIWFFATRIAGLIRHQEQRLSEKEMLLNEIHHRVKNNLQVISSLLGLQSRRSESEEVRSAIEQSKRRILAMASAHEAVYRDADMGRVSLPEYFDDIIHSTRQAAASSSVSITSNLAPIDLGMEQAIPLGLVLGELLMNALEHAFTGRDGGSIRVTLERASDRVRLCVQDDGSGLSPDAVDKRDSLGLVLVRALAEQVGGELSITSDGGTRVELSVPSQARA